jgi:hypothetical protein
MGNGLLAMGFQERASKPGLNLLPIAYSLLPEYQFGGLDL